MGKLIFCYGTMGSSKSAELLMWRYNYMRAGYSVCLMKPKIDTREKFLSERMGEVSSRIGLTAKCFLIDQTMEEWKSEIEANDIIMIDEAQFLTRANVYDLARIVDELDIPVMAFGLKNDFQNNLFEGSKYLLLLSDKIEEIKTICHYCSRKATMVLRMEDGEPVYEGVQVQIGGHESYISVCRKHWFNPPRERIVPLKQN